MMKWKVVKGPRSASVDRSLDCLKKNAAFPVCISDTNNNTKPPAKQQDGSFVRKPSLVASDCINWKGFLGLTRQRSESNLSVLAPPDHRPRQRSRSEVRHPPVPPLGWLQREKTVVAGTRHRPRGRTIADQADEHKVPPRRSRNKGQAPKPDVNLHPNGEGAAVTCQLLERKASPRATPRSTVVAVEVHADNRAVEKRDVDRNGKKNAEVHSVVEKRDAKKKRDPGNNRENGKDVEKKDIEVESEKVEERGNPDENEEEPSCTERMGGSGGQLPAARARAAGRGNPENEEELSERLECTEDHKRPHRVYRRPQNGEEPSERLEGHHPPEEVLEEKERLQEVQIEIPPFRIDTPDYSTLESEFDKNNRPPDDIDEKNNNLKNAVDIEKNGGDLSGILRDPSSATGRKVVRFDLIESYRKQQMDDEEEEEKRPLDVNSNEIVDCPHMRVDLVVKPSECLLSVDPPTHLVVKKSFVLTVAKQEKGFRSLCANKRPEPPVTHEDPKISVTFLCGTPSHHPVRVRSISVPPPQQTPPDVVPLPPPLVRGRSRDRRSKERHSKRSKSAKKKDTSHHMPQAVIDELAQVLEKRKPSLDRPTANPT